MTIAPRTLVEQLRSSGQSHVLRSWDDLDTDAQARLLGQLALVDWNEFAHLQRLAAARDGARPAAVDLDSAVSPRCLRLRCPANPITPSAAIARGEEALRAGQIGAILVAGGQEIGRAHV